MCIEIVGLAVLVGWVRGGQVTNLARTPLRGLPWFILVGAFEVIMRFTQSPERRLVYQALSLAELAVVAGLLWVNRHLPGVSLALAGLTLNSVVMAANGGLMPVSEWAATASGQGAYISELVSGQSPRHIMLNPQTRLPALADIIPVPPPYPWPRVLSIGDILLFSGIARFTIWGMLCQHEGG
ncbi:MAG: DUF5317 domain-containing protein [Firmicutes bacterium]|jgi:hypothetical protein|nr:DUF5317 domain-containing protein [Bacillota bacterium]